MAAVAQDVGKVTFNLYWVGPYKLTKDGAEWHVKDVEYADKVNAFTGHINRDLPPASPQLLTIWNGLNGKETQNFPLSIEFAKNMGKVTPNLSVSIRRCEPTGELFKDLTGIDVAIVKRPEEYRNGQSYNLTVENQEGALSAAIDESLTEADALARRLIDVQRTEACASVISSRGGAAYAADEYKMPESTASLLAQLDRAKADLERAKRPFQDILEGEPLKAATAEMTAARDRVMALQDKLRARGIPFVEVQSEHHGYDCVIC